MIDPIAQYSSTRTRLISFATTRKKRFACNDTHRPSKNDALLLMVQDPTGILLRKLGDVGPLICGVKWSWSVAQNHSCATLLPSWRRLF
jgi:hypothetical protein